MQFTSWLIFYNISKRKATEASVPRENSRLSSLPATKALAMWETSGKGSELKI